MQIQTRTKTATTTTGATKTQMPQIRIADANENSNQNQNQNQINRINRIKKKFFSDFVRLFLLNCVLYVFILLNNFVQHFIYTHSRRRRRHRRHRNANKFTKYLEKIACKRISIEENVPNAKATENHISNHRTSNNNLLCLQWRWWWRHSITVNHNSIRTLHYAYFKIINVISIIINTSNTINSNSRNSKCSKSSNIINNIVIRRVDVVDLIIEKTTTALRNMINIVRVQQLQLQLHKIKQKLQQHKEKNHLQQLLQQGICIIRLISLKRFSQIPTAQRRTNQEKKEITATAAGAVAITLPVPVKTLDQPTLKKEATTIKQQLPQVETSLPLLPLPESCMLARLILMRWLKYIAIRLQFYKFNIRFAMTTTACIRASNASTLAMVMAVSTPTPTKTETAKAKKTSKREEKGKGEKNCNSTTETTTLRNFSTDSLQIVGNSAGAINSGGNAETETEAQAATDADVDVDAVGVDVDVDADSIEYSSCNGFRNGNRNRVNDKGYNTEFAVDAGNGKKCGNPLQVSSQILMLAKCVSPSTSSSSTMPSPLFSSPCCRVIRNTNSITTITHKKIIPTKIVQRHGNGGMATSFLLLHRCLIMLILLSTLWQESECFHGTVKLSSNTVKTKYGQLRGIVVRSTPSLVEAYLGIPYASPPVGSLRFMPPITPSTWKNVRNADRFSPVCSQTVPIPPNGPEALLEVPRARLAQLRRLLPLLKNQSEDCLYLNIYVPYENRRHRRFAEHDESIPKLSTILFIHGESYEWNSGNPYDGSELASHGNVIVVTINFRLGIFGFLKTGGKESSQGNFGLMDLVAGLHWLKENLPSFGGDPQSITLLGHGTGAALANILVVSPIASDLIQRTVLVSGSALAPWAIQRNPLLVKRRVAEQTGCHGDMLFDDLAPCLRTKSVSDLLAVTIDHPRFLVGFAPFIDGTVISPNINAIGALTLPLGSAIVSTSGIEFANFPKRELIFCLTSVESYLDLSAQDLEFGFNETRRDRILRTFVRNNYHYHLNEIFAVLKNEYTDWEKAIRNPLSSRDATLAFLSDGHTASSLIKLGYMHSLRGGRNYFLHFKHKTMEEEYPQRTGSVRGEDVPFWFGLPVSPLFPYNYTTQEKQISRLMLRYLANFAKTGNPNQSTKTSQPPSSSTSIISSNVEQQQQLNINTVSSDSQQFNQYSHSKVKRASLKTEPLINRFLNISAMNNQGNIDHTAATRQALDLAIIYNQRRSNAMRDKRTNHRRHLRSNDDPNQSGFTNLNFDSDRLPLWDAYDVVNQFYLELGNKIEVLSHYRGHKLSMWLNLIPQLHKHSNINDQSMRHHQFPDDLHNHNLYEGVVRPQLQTKPADEEEIIVIQAPKTGTTGIGITLNKTSTPSGIIVTTAPTTTECGVDGALLITTDLTTQSSNDNRSLAETQKDLATASTGLIGNLEVLRRLSGKQFQSYTTALVATVAVGCFLLILNILIFAGIYHQREKRARDAKTKEELQDSDTSKNSSLMKLNTVGLSVPGEMGKTTVIFGEYNCYDEKTKQMQTALDEKLLVELPPPTVQAALHDTNWVCSTSTLDLLKTKHHHGPSMQDTTTTNIAVVPNLLTSNESNDMQIHPMANIEMATYNPLPLDAATALQQQSKRGSFVAATAAAVLNINQFDYAVQSSDQMSFKDIENAVKASTDDIVRDMDMDDDIPEPPPPPRSFQQQQHQQQHQQQIQATQQPSGSGGGGGGGILRQSGGSSIASTSGGKKRVHIQEISV